MSDYTARSVARPTAAFALTLLGGLWMIFSSTFWGHGWGPGMHGRGMHGDQPHHNGWDAGPMPWMHQRGLVHAFLPDGTWWPWLGLAAGLLVLAAAVMLYTRPSQRVTWGTVVLVVATISFFVGAGGLLGAVLAVAGGILALTWRPPAHEPSAASPPHQG